MEQCRLCFSETSTFGVDAINRTLMKCPVCAYVFVGSAHFLSEKEEKKRYLFHKNSIEDKGYVDFLEKLLRPLRSFLKEGSRILDYGSGPNPVLAQILEREGYSVDIYDPYFASEKTKTSVDVITSTEVFEHLKNPGIEIQDLVSQLPAGGMLGVMTLLYNEETDFSTWHYTKDPTHVGFFCRETFNWIAERFSFKIIFFDNERSLLFRKV